MVYEFTATDDTKYFFGLHLVSSDDYRYVLNAHGDVIALVSKTGSTVAKYYEYDAFGNEINPDASDTNPYRYCGEYYDFESDTIYLRARYYSPSHGRFTQVDTARDGLNWYAYCGNNPIAFVDPWGTDAIVITTSTTSVYCNAHTSVIAQDADGKWFYFYWGDKNCVVVEVPSDAMSDLDSFNSWLAENGAGKEGEGTDKLLHDSSSDYTTATYIEGDFTDSVDYYNKIVNDSNVTDNKNPAYGLLSFNCMHASYEGLKLGKLTNGDSFSDFAEFDGFGSVRPNDFRVMIRETFANQSFSKSDAYAQATGNVGKKKPFFQSKNYYNKGQKYGRILKGA